MDDTRLKQLESSIEEIKASQNKIAVALLGSYEKNSVGLIEETRNLRRDVDTLSNVSRVHTVQVEEVLEFKRDTKKVVASIAVVVPFIFEILKIAATSLWEMLKSK